MSGTIKVLLMAADPGEGVAGLRLDREIRGALEAIRAGRGVNELEIATELAVRADDLGTALLRHDPQIVHFAGHGDGGYGIIMDDEERVPADELAALFTAHSQLRVVVLNACDTLPVAQVLGEVVDYVVAMEAVMDDDAAIHFSGAFYAALAFGRAVPVAFEHARSATRGRFGERRAIPHLLVRAGADARPLEGTAAPEEPRSSADPDRQVTRVEDIEAAVAADIVNEAEGGGGAPISQENHVSRSKFQGPLKIGNRLTR
ncbi:CHAT domain-containing protein [Longimicrobium sp.]|uniref:CHAT domain-containing protein n=1 Tax=Longimicrobium sp. TaxID=2029185 RepID=UPI003B3B47E7